MNILAFYLPQYHSIKENDMWWGKDYTEWDSLKRGEVLSEGQYQPRIPLNNNYYNLLDVEVMKWQAEIARNHGIYGFCVYHYWFDGKLLLEKPMENLLKRKDIDFPFCFCWANEDWSNIWEGNLKELKILISNSYDNKEEWIDHFNYLLPFFKDDRYIKHNNKPVFVIYNPLLIKQMHLIYECWNNLALQYGFDGIELLYQNGNTIIVDDKRKDDFSYGIEYYPGLIGYLKQGKNNIKLRMKLHEIVTSLRKKTGILTTRKLSNNNLDNNYVKQIEDYDEDWNFILNRIPENDKIIPGAFVDWDNTPRKKYAGKIIKGATPEKFEHYLIKQIRRAKTIYKKNVIFIFAWNEWSEGGYLEPDEKYKYSYLQAVKNALEKENELPDMSRPFEIERR